MLRLTYVSFDRFPAPKGAAVHIAAFTSGLAKSFGSVNLLTLPPSPDEPQRSIAGVNHATLPGQGPHLVSQIMNFRTALEHWLRTHERSDIIHVRSPFEGYPIARDGKRHAEHLVYEVNGLPSIELKYHHPGIDEDRELMRKLLHQEQALMDGADLLITPSTVTAAYLSSRGVNANRIKVIPNGVDLETFTFAPPPQDNAIKKLLYVGTLSGWQGLGSILTALSTLRQTLPVELVVIGVARLRQLRRFQELAQDLGVAPFVQWQPPMAQAELVKWHHQCDIALAPLVPNDRNFLQGCCPLKVLEAMAAGTPVIASDLPVVSDILRNSVEGILVAPGNTEALIEAIRQLLNDPDRGQRIAGAARARIEEDFTWQRAQDALVASYEDLLGRRDIAKANTSSRAADSAPA
jgi:glycosyltransferase involved in cell wall biosynthesis